MADARREKTTGIGAYRRGAAVFGLLVLFGVFCWIITVAPAPISLALAIAAAVTWSVWLDRQEHR
jgi:hypothetical protein